MYHKQFFHFAEDAARPTDGPTGQAIRAVALLVQYSATTQAGGETLTEEHREFRGSMVTEAVRDLVALVMRGSSGRNSDSASQQESDMMSPAQPLDQSSQQQRQRLKLIIDNPKLAEEAFPDPHIRANILPLLDDLDRLASDIPDKAETQET